MKGDHALNDKNSRIAQTIKETRQRRKSQVCKVYELKVNCHHTSKETYAKFHQWFKEAKWVINDVIRSDDAFQYNYNDHKEVVHFDKDGNELKDKISIRSGVHQRLVQGVVNDICNLSKAKKKGLKVGRLKFRAEVNCIPMKTGMLKVVNSKTITIPGFLKLKVYGLEQFIGKEHEIADSRIVRRASGIYIKVTVMFPKTSEALCLKEHSVGLDFGIKDNITDSDGNKYNFITPESEQLKFLQRQLKKKQKGSKRYWNLRRQIQREYESISNKRNDDANQFVAKLRKENDMIYFQDECLSQWRRFSKGFGRKVQWSSMGRIKAQLVRLQKVNESYMLDKWFASTQLCPMCGKKNKHTLKERTYTCDCGYSEDRDVHAARNMLKFGRLKQKTLWLEQPSAEVSPSGIKFVVNGLVVRGTVEAKKEDSSL
jgi:transposase